MLSPDPVKPEEEAPMTAVEEHVADPAGEAPGSRQPAKGHIPRSTSRVGRKSALCLLFVLTVLVIVRPSPHELRSTLPHNLGDPALNTWILAWQSHAVIADPGSWFDGNIFHPTGNALGYSELMLPLVPPFAIIYGATGNAVLAHNMVLLALLVLSLLATYKFGRSLHLSPVASYLAALGFTFGAFTFAHLGHLQLLTLGTFPLALWCLVRLFERQRSRDGVLVGAASAGLVTACLYYGAIWMVWLVVAAVVHIVIGLRRRERTWLRPLATAGATTGALLAPVAALLLWFQGQAGFERALAEDRGLRASDVLAPAPGSYLYGDAAAAMFARPEAHEHTFFPGLVVLALALVGALHVASRGPGLLAGWRDRTIGRSSVDQAWVVLVLGGAVSFVIALGPTVLGLPAPFRFLYHVVPGFDAIRVPARLAVPGFLVVALLAGVGVDRLARAFGWRPAVLGMAAVVVTAVELAAPFPRVDARPGPVDAGRYAAIAALPPGAIVELPAAGSGAGMAGVFEESPRLLYSIGDWRPRFNGTSGGWPPGYFEAADTLNRFPDADSLRLLDELDLRHVILRVSEDGEFSYRPHEAAAIVAALPVGASVQQIPGGYAVDLQPGT
jgi:hypothetical protein